MSEDFWYAVIHVLGKLKLWKPYIYAADLVIERYYRGIEDEDLGISIIKKRNSCERK